MKQSMILLSALLLTGCATPVPVTMKFPAAPESIKVTCPDLDKVKDDEQQLSELMKIVVKNYGSYYECKVKIDAWIEWYNKQKEISDSITK